MAIRYVSSLATGTGDGTLLDPWTLQQGATGTLAGDECRIMADGVYSPTATINFDTVAGTAASYPIFIGADASGNVTGARPTISGASLPASNDLFYLNATNQRILFENLILDAAKRYAVNVNSTVYGTMFNCRFSNTVGTGYGVFINGSGSRISAINNEFFSNVVGIGGNNNLRLERSMLYGNLFIGNTLAGARCGPDCTISKNIFIRNAIGLSNSSGQFGRGRIDGNVFLGNTSHGIESSTVSENEQIFIANNIFRNNGGYALNTNSGDIPRFFLYNNCFSNNTSGNVDINSGVPWGEGHIFADPKFEDETSGSEDIRTQTGSPCRNMGLGPVGY
jgi:hypothetical protein